MGIETGQRVHQYVVGDRIGEGGMGVVWRARDTVLDREVAIKTLPDDLAADPDRLARLEREARLLAALSHPNVAAVYGLHEAPTDDSGKAGPRFIAMELVDGETLFDRLRRAPLPLDETLEIARQVAEALEAAHDRGIVHRDLKPANVKIRPDGTVKVLDFGLARGTADPPSGAGMDAPTATAGTTPGVVLGTAPYMSPEQARGRPVDKRTDIWALGCILYECLTGSRPFTGDSTTDVLAQIVTREPDFAALPGATPEFLVRLMRRCLEKDPRRRLRDAGELRVAIEELGSAPRATVASASPAPARATKSPRTILPWALVALLAVALVGTLLGRGERTREAASVASRWSIAVPAGARVALPTPGGMFDYSRMVAISPDGRRIAFSVREPGGRTRLYLKAQAPVPQPISGTTGGRAPFFSPDGAWLGFFDGFVLYKVALAGGAPQKLCELGRAVSFDATWSPDGDTIVFATDDGLWRVSADGGAPVQLTTPAVDGGEVGHHAPRFFADGRSVLFTVSEPSGVHLATLDLASASWEKVLENASLGVPLRGDRLVFARAGELLAAPYEAGARRVGGSAVPVLQNVETTPGLGGVVLTQFDVSASGTLVWVPAAANRPPDRLLWVDFDGTETVVTEGPGTWVHPRLSPDGSRVSIDIHTPDGKRDVYVYELERGRFRQLTRTGMSWESEWRPDGERIALLSGAPAGQWSLFWVATDFSGPEELLYRSSHIIPGGWLPDGRSLLYTEWVVGGIWSLSPDGERQPELVLRAPGRPVFPRLSPDGKWMAYVETESGRGEVFVQSFPDLGPKYKVSVAGGTEPVWSRDGRRLFFRRGDGMFAVDVAHGARLRFGTPRLLFTGEYDSAEVGHQHYDISLENDRFLMVRHGVPDGPSEVRVVLHWLDELD